MTSKDTFPLKNMSSEYKIEYFTIFYNNVTDIYTAALILPDGSTVTHSFSSYEDCVKAQDILMLPIMRALYANG